MAAFSYQQYPNPSFLLDAAGYFPTASSSDVPLHPHHQQQDLSFSTSGFPFYYHTPHHDQATSTINAPTAVVSKISTVGAGNNFTTTATHESSSSSSLGSGASDEKHWVTTSPTSSAQRSETIVVSRTTPSPMEKKRKDKPNVGKEVKSRKERKCSADQVKRGREERKAADQPDPPSGYIHVRARRGQATDSHSLAERVRRERISERMKMLQGLVPGCDKVTGKALMLDEIINYVQSLQNQVEFLSMKLASTNPILYDFGFALDEYMVQSEKPESMSTPLPSIQQPSHIQPTAFADTTNNYPMLDASIPFSLQGQGPSSFSQDNSSNFVTQVGDNRQRFLNRYNSMCSFQ